MMRFVLTVAFGATALFGLSNAAESNAAKSTSAGPRLPLDDPWFVEGQKTLAARARLKPNTKRARNVILFVGDGMDPTTIAAARIFDGQTRGEQGEENYLSFERFPYLAMAKTYNTNAQTPDSAGTMSAMATGVKTKAGIISLTDAAPHGECAATKTAAALTIGQLAEKSGLALGVVTTTRITHATPAAVYANAANRDWEADANLTDEARAGGCKDIARQLVEFSHGDGPDVAFGGGRQKFLPDSAPDPEYANRKGERKDGRDLTAEWTAKSNNRLFVWNKEGFDKIEADGAPKVLGLFETSHMQYEADRKDDKGGEPSLAEMTAKAIDLLRQDKDGFFLLVEGGRIDHAHHGGNAARAFRDTQAFSEAVAAALAKVDLKETLVIVTADHGHTMSFAGYPAKGNDILGLVRQPEGAEGGETNADGFALAADKKPYTTLAYANGPGSVYAKASKAGVRAAPTHAEASALDFRQPAIVPTSSETHGGQDVTIYATGPRAHLFGGVVEQNYVFHVIENALDLRKRAGELAADLREERGSE